MPRRAHGSPLSPAGTSAALRGRSRMWPTEESTTYSSPRYPAMVFALAGDSTITSLVTPTGKDPDGRTVNTPVRRDVGERTAGQLAGPAPGPEPGPGVRRRSASPWDLSTTSRTTVPVGDARNSVSSTSTRI